MFLNTNSHQIIEKLSNENVTANINEQREKKQGVITEEKYADKMMIK